MSKQIKKKRKKEAIIEATKSSANKFDDLKVKNPTDSLAGKILIAVIALGMIGGSIVGIIYQMLNSGI